MCARVSACAVLTVLWLVFGVGLSPCWAAGLTAAGCNEELLVLVYDPGEFAGTGFRVVGWFEGREDEPYLLESASSSGLSGSSHESGSVIRFDVSLDTLLEVEPGLRDADFFIAVAAHPLTKEGLIARVRRTVGLEADTGANGLGGAVALTTESALGTGNAGGWTYFSLKDEPGCKNIYDGLMADEVGGLETYRSSHLERAEEKYGEYLADNESIRAELDGYREEINEIVADVTEDPLQRISYSSDGKRYVYKGKKKKSDDGSNTISWKVDGIKSKSLQRLDKKVLKLREKIFNNNKQLQFIGDKLKRLRGD